MRVWGPEQNGMHTQMTDDSAKSRPKSKAQREIDENLKRVYDEALKEEIPDRFKQLLAQLKEKEQRK